MKVIEYKKILIKRGIKFSDGYEYLEFNYDIFNENPVINTTKSRIRITTSSYLIRLVSKNTYEQNINKIKLPKVIMNFSKSDCLYDVSKEYQLFDIKYCENISDVNKIIG